MRTEVITIFRQPFLGLTVPNFSLKGTIWCFQVVARDGHKLYLLGLIYTVGETIKKKSRNFVVTSKRMTTIFEKK